MNIKSALIWATKKLKNKKITSAELDAEVLLSYVLKKPREFLYTYPEKVLTSRPAFVPKAFGTSAGRQVQGFKALISRRLKFEPVAYLTNHKEFYGLDFAVNKHVFIPRPETELLVDEIINYIKKIKTIRHKPYAICDVGTGSGCIIISLAKLLPTICPKIYLPAKACGFRRWQAGAISYYATDISQAALKVAKKNAKKHQVKIQFFQGNLLQPLKNRKIDIIIANLPYVSKKLIKKDLKYEPIIALKEANYYQKLFWQIKNLKWKPQFIFLEISPLNATKVKKQIKKYFPQPHLIPPLSKRRKGGVEIKKDLNNLNRVIKCKIKN